MRRSLSLSYVVHRLRIRTSTSGVRAGQTSRYLGLSIAASLCLVCLLLSACSSPLSGATASPTAATQALSKTSWCSKSLMIFRDEGASGTPTGTSTASATGTPTSTNTPAAQTVTDWSLVKANLGFTVYLPTTLPNHSCLVSAQATIHDPIFGGSFTIGYLLPDHTSLSFSEAPLKSQNTSFQCNITGGITSTPTKSTPVAGGTVPANETPTVTVTPPRAQPTPALTMATSQLCSGAKNTTNIVLSGPGTVQHLQQVFDGLQPNITWIPAA